MRSVSVSVLLVAGSLGLSCSDMGALTPSGLSITVPQIRYHLSDTLRFTIVNTGDQKYLLGASNGKLTYFLQSGTYGNWQDRDSINLYLGPTLAIYAPIVLSPGRSRVESLALSKVRREPLGSCRVRIIAVVNGQLRSEDQYSNAFEFGN